VSDSGYAIILDSSYDAILLRDVCEREALKYAERAAVAVAAHARTRNNERHAIFAKYAERFEHIRLQQVKQIQDLLGIAP
jgi:hypothetical protein